MFLLFWKIVYNSLFKHIILDFLLILIETNLLEYPHLIFSYLNTLIQISKKSHIEENYTTRLSNVLNYLKLTYQNTHYFTEFEIEFTALHIRTDLFVEFTHFEIIVYERVFFLPSLKL